MAQGFYQDTQRCYGCKTCTVACANEKMLEAGVVLRRVRWIDTADGQAFISMACNHCDEPACLANCPQGAYTKDEETGLVVQDHELCIGCKTCVNMCPFNAPAFCESETKVYKCDGCIDRQRAGEMTVCTVACPVGNILMADADSLPEGDSIKDMVDTKPNYTLAADSDIADNLATIFADIDGAEGMVDTGCEGYPQQ